MSDMLVKLYDLPDPEPVYEKARENGIEVRQAMVSEMQIVLDFVREKFGESWHSQCLVSFMRQPIACFIAIAGRRLVGFACYDATRPDYFGPTGVDESVRGRGAGAALLLKALWAMREQGYAYAIIGWVGPADFYTRVCGAQLIADSTPGAYAGLLRREG